MRLHWEIWVALRYTERYGCGTKIHQEIWMTPRDTPRDMCGWTKIEKVFYTLRLLEPITKFMWLPKTIELILGLITQIMEFCNPCFNVLLTILFVHCLEIDLLHDCDLNDVWLLSNYHMIGNDIDCYYLIIKWLYRRRPQKS